MLLANNILVGPDEQCLVIPEIGINHEGSLAVAKEMAASAHKAGARLIKHQTHICHDEMSHEAKGVIPGNSDVSIFDVMDRCALNEEEELEFKEYVEGLGMFFLSTPFSRAAAERLERFGVHAYKIGSGEMNNYPLLSQIAEYGKPMIVSTGMNGIDSVRKAVDILERYNVPYALLHTTNLYPTAPGQVRLGAMVELMEAFPGVPIGLSDHTLNNNACIAAMGLGACIVERHYTDNKGRTGPDIICSMDEDELSALLQAAKEVPRMRGGKKAALPEEQVTIDFAYASVVSTEHIHTGEAFTKDNLWVKRPGTGELPASLYEDIIGRHATCDIDADCQIKTSMVEGL